MIPGPSTRDPKVTKPDFRPCSACMPHSQAPLCLCTLWLISNQPEGTFGRLRYFLGKCVRLTNEQLDADRSASDRSEVQTVSSSHRDVRRTVVEGSLKTSLLIVRADAFSLSSCEDE